MEETCLESYTFFHEVFGASFYSLLLLSLLLLLLKVKQVKLSLCLTNLALRHEGVWGSQCIDPHFLDLGTVR
jgi:hypothetical protein